MTAQGQLYEARLDGRLLCTSRTPFFSAARALIDERADPTETLEMTREGSTQVDIRQTLHVAACLTVEEGANTGPTIRDYREPAFA